MRSMAVCPTLLGPSVESWQTQALDTLAALHDPPRMRAPCPVMCEDQVLQQTSIRTASCMVMAYSLEYLERTRVG